MTPPSYGCDIEPAKPPSAAAHACCSTTTTTTTTTTTITNTQAHVHAHKTACFTVSLTTAHTLLPHPIYAPPIPVPVYYPSSAAHHPQQLLTLLVAAVSLIVRAL